MISPVSLHPASSVTPVSDIGTASAVSKLHAANLHHNVSAVKPMFAAAAVLAPVAAGLTALHSESSKVNEVSASQKNEKSGNNLPDSMLPSRHFMAQLQNMQNKLNELKEKGLSMGKDADLKQVGFTSLPANSAINFYSKA